MRRAAVDQAPHVFGQARHIERPVLHPDIDIVGPAMGVLLARSVGQRVAGVAAAVIYRLVLRQQLDGSVDAVYHDRLLSADPNKTTLRQICGIM
jgi:hypothetical protein